MKSRIGCLGASALLVFACATPETQTSSAEDELVATGSSDAVEGVTPAGGAAFDLGPGPDREIYSLRAGPGMLRVNVTWSGAGAMTVRLSEANKSGVSKVGGRASPKSSSIVPTYVRTASGRSPLSLVRNVTRPTFFRIEIVSPTGEPEGTLTAESDGVAVSLRRRDAQDLAASGLATNNRSQRRSRALAMRKIERYRLGVRVSETDRAIARRLDALSVAEREPFLRAAKRFRRLPPGTLARIADSEIAGISPLVDLPAALVERVKAAGIRRPSHLAISRGSSEGIVSNRLTWQDNSSSELGFAIERRCFDDKPFVEVARVGRDATSYQDEYQSGPGAPCGARIDTYDPSAFYRVRAFGEAQGEWVPARTTFNRDRLEFVTEPGHFETYEAFSAYSNIASANGVLPKGALFSIQVDSLRCNRESRWDGLSNSDEPYLIATVIGGVNPMTGAPVVRSQWRSASGDDVDTGETVFRDASENPSAQFGALVGVDRTTGVPFGAPLGDAWFPSLPRTTVLLTVMESDDGDPGSVGRDLMNALSVLGDIAGWFGGAMGEVFDLATDIALFFYNLWAADDHVGTVRFATTGAYEERLLPDAGSERTEAIPINGGSAGAYTVGLRIRKIRQSEP